MFDLTVEPLIFFLCLAKGFLIAIESPGYYAKACFEIIHSYGGPNLNGGIDCFDLASDSRRNGSSSSNVSIFSENLSVLVQKRSSDYFIAMTIATSISVGIGNIFFGVHADRKGRKTAIIVGQIGIICQILLWTCTLFWMKDAPMYVNPLVLFFIGFSGLLYGTLSASSQYLGDLYAHENNMMWKITSMNTALFFGMIGGIFGAGAILKFLDFAQTLSLALIPAAISVILACFMIQNPLSKGITLQDPESEFEPVQTGPAGNFCSSICQDLRNGFTEIWLTLTRARPGGKRKILWLSFLAYFCARASDQGAEGVLSLYSFGPPFHLTPSEHAWFTGLNNGLQAIGALLGAAFLKKALKVSDEFCMLIGLSSVIARFAVVAAATSKTFLLLSSVSGMLSDVFLSSFQAFLYRLISEDEYGKITALEITSIHIAMVVTGTVFNTLYRSTLEVFPQTVFILVTVFPVPAFIFFAWVWGTNKSFEAEIPGI